MRSRVAALLAVLLLVSACQGDEAPPRERQAAGPPVTSTAGVTEPPATTGEGGGSTGQAAPEQAGTDRATMEQVVRAWSDRLNAERNEALADLFTLPAVISQAGVVVELESYEEIAAWFAGLPCAGTVLSIEYPEPNVALAVFALDHRSPASPCDAPPGTRAAARFVFQGGKVAVWEQVPVPGEEREPPSGGVIA